ncbi:MAG: hypothetical protein LBM13_05070 [Candidatus Ancillula sp.]|nr:hypothetical protein [Candidatus Ancillula sp.]
MVEFQRDGIRTKIMKKKQVISGIIIILSVIILLILGFYFLTKMVQPSKQIVTSSSQVYSQSDLSGDAETLRISLEDKKIRGKMINEACSEIKKIGGMVSLVTGGEVDGKTVDSDCNNKTNPVSNFTVSQDKKVVLYYQP